MSLRNILTLFRGPSRTDLDQAMTVESRPGSLVHKDFREFTAPARRQRGGSLQMGRSGNSRLAQIAIVPGMGGNIP